MLFCIPIGGGIPAGVLLARSCDIGWPAMIILYFVSDVILACVFEPVLKLMIAVGRRVEFLGRVTAALKQAVRKTTAPYGSAAGPLALILIAFGVDPMTGRAAAHAAGHGFLSGWAIAITGDMFYFTLIMVSTLRLNSLLGDGTWTTVIIMAAMFIVPGLIKRWRERRGRAA
ncbi:MAG: hypothetical protein A2V88_11675 [Elusimicrobia bacterium RBG_16_66_12]|nr:MAG: hypothetical protein A2V88_11675 [Elusimicrobia bacterium RBG_16_66_12]